MAGTDLDAVIRKLAKQQHKTLTAAVKSTRDRYNTLAARTKDGEARQRYKQIARQAAEEGSAAIRRLQMSADNIADSYARAIRRITETAVTGAKNGVPSQTTASGKKTAKKIVKKKARS